MAYSGAQTNYNYDGFKVSGSFFSRYPETLEQDAGRATPLAQYTIMGKKKLTVPTTGTADAGNTGDGTVTAVAKIAGVTKVGAYNLEVTGAVANGGVFKLEDPDGALIADGLTMTAGAGAATVFNAGGMTFTITDGATDFIIGDKFAITTVAVNKYIPLDPAGLDGSGDFAGIYIGDAVLAATIIAGDVTISIVTNGNGAIVSADKLVFENSAALTTILPSGKTLREEMAALDISVADRYDFDHVQA